MELSRLEQKIMGMVREGDVITIDTVYGLGRMFKFAGKSTLKEATFNLVKKGALIRIKRGKYMVVKAPENYDALRIANYLFDGYIAITTALFVYGYNQTKSFVIFGTTSYRKKSTRIGEYLYIALPTGRFTFGSTYYNGYKVSTKAKTLLDCVYHIHYIEDFDPLFDMIHDMDKKDFSELLGYLDMVKNSSMIQRIGFMLEKAGTAEGLLATVHRKAGKSVVRLDPKVKACINYDRRWKVFDNINVSRFRR